MPWLYFALSAVCFAIAVRTQSLGIAAVCLLFALGLLIAGALGLAARRIESRSQSPAGLLGPEQAALMQRRGTAASGDRTPASDADGVVDGSADAGGD